MNKIFVVATVFVVCFGVLGFVHYSMNTLPSPVEIDTKRQPTLGSREASVHIVVFQDFKCSGCKYFADEIYPHIKKKYIDTGKAKYTIIPLAFIAGSKEVAHAALCVHYVNPEAFFTYVDQLFREFSWEYSDWSSRENLFAYAARIQKLDQFQFRSCFNRFNHEKTLQRNFSLANELLGKRLATPSVFINGVEMKGYSLSHLSKEIDRQLWESEQ